MQGGGGAERDRTADLLIANEALSQLSYSPAMRGLKSSQGEAQVKGRERIAAGQGRIVAWAGPDR